MDNINLVLDPLIKILEQIEKPPTSLSKPHYLRFDGVKRELTAVSKALQRSMAIRAHQDAGCWMEVGKEAHSEDKANSIRMRGL